MITGVSSIVTDGESLNSGDRNGLWKKLDEEKSANDPHHGPLLKIWCAAHIICLRYSFVITAVVFPTGRKEMMNQEDFCASGETRTEYRLYVSWLMSPTF